jgi:competence protein ComEA
MKKLLLALALWLAFAGAAFAAVNINTATKEELISLKGIGEKKAQAIIDYRKKHGDFKTVDDLEKVDGIGPGTMKQLRSQLSVTGKTTVEKSDAKAKAAAPAKTKAVEAKKVEAPKAEAVKADKAKEKVAEKSKAETKVEKKTAEKDTKKVTEAKPADTKKAADAKASDTKGESKDEKKTEKK